MTDKRLLYRVILKVLGAIGIIALLLVFFNATFYTNIETEEVVIDVDDTKVDVSSFVSGSNTVVRWNNQRVGILKRSDANQLALISQSSEAPESNVISINEHPWRSIDPRIFVYFDVGDSGHCPLFFQNDAKEILFKDTCSSNWFDSQGRFKSDGTAGLKIPPHHYSKEGQLVIGRWLTE
jgi:hypothetical protein